MPKQTHKVVKDPKISARYLAACMAGSERRARAIVRDCRYRPIARLIQHDEAKSAISSFIRGGSEDLETLAAREQQLRLRIADSDFDRDLYDHNADYIARFIKTRDALAIPDVDILPPGQVPPLTLNGVKVTFDLAFRLVRVTKTNKVRLGAGALRYAKGQPLKADEAENQSALIHGYLARTNVDEAASAEHKLCLTIDAQSGTCHSAPGDAISRFANMEAYCASIAERWENIEPPKNAVLE